MAHRTRARDKILTAAAVVLAVLIVLPAGIFAGVTADGSPRASLLAADETSRHAVIAVQESFEKAAEETTDPQLAQTDALYNEMADAVLDYIIEDSMTDYEKCCAVYNYLHRIPYINYVYSEDWKENGYMMLLYRGGDCFGYYSASRLLLERLGYVVIEVENRNDFRHVWCLVSTDNGETWWHFDPTCWSWGSDGYLCMVTDEDLTIYAYRHYVGVNTVSHDWDRQKIAEEIQAYKDSQKPQFYYLYPPENAEPFKKS